MLSNFHTSIIESLKFKVLFFSMLVIFFIGLLIGFFPLKIDQDITASLPNGEEFK